MNIYCQLNLAQNQIKKIVPERVKIFYESFKKGDKYVLRDMIILGVLLSQGSPETKAKLMFEAFDMKNSKELAKEDIAKLYDVSYKIAVERAEILIGEDNPIKIGKDEHDEYMEKLKKGKKIFKESFLSEIFGDAELVSLQRFRETFTEGKNAKWLSSSGFRQTLKEFGVSRIREKFSAKEESKDKENLNTGESNSKKDHKKSSDTGGDEVN